jgi:hypothetical protein
MEMTLGTIHRILAALLAAVALAVHAEAPMRVEGVQKGAWVDRAGAPEPLVAGMELLPSDRVRTGAGARVQLRLAEGSTVKLGENAYLDIERAEATGIFRATLNVVQGAFRFTTGAAARNARREVDIKVRSIVAGIRGTDLWGRSNEERDLVCLIEGKITVAALGGPAVTMSEPLDFFQKPRGAPALPVGRADPKQLAEWAQETEPLK